MTSLRSRLLTSSGMMCICEPHAGRVRMSYSTVSSDYIKESQWIVFISPYAFVLQGVSGYLNHHTTPHRTTIRFSKEGIDQLEILCFSELTTLCILHREYCSEPNKCLKICAKMTCSKMKRWEVHTVLWFGFVMLCSCYFVIGWSSQLISVSHVYSQMTIHRYCNSMWTVV